MNARLVYAGLLLCFALGLGLGAAGTWAITAWRLSPAGDRPAAAQDRAPQQFLLERLKAELRLRPGQERAVRDLLDEDARRLEDLARKRGNEVTELVDRLAAVLDPDQADRLRAIDAERRSRAAPAARRDRPGPRETDRKPPRPDGEQRRDGRPGPPAG